MPWAVRPPSANLAHSPLSSNYLVRPAVTTLGISSETTFLELQTELAEGRPRAPSNQASITRSHPPRWTDICSGFGAVLRGLVRAREPEPPSATRTFFQLDLDISRRLMPSGDGGPVLNARSSVR